jgi:S-phase kinase-associated protein 1
MADDSSASIAAVVVADKEREKLKLVSADEQEFEVERRVLRQSVTIKNMMEDIEDFDGAIPLPNVSGATLAKVIDYCKHHVDDPPKPTQPESSSGGGVEAQMDPWDKDFMQIDNQVIFSLVLASNYLDVKPLLDLTCKHIANMIKGKTPEEIRKTFLLKNDFTPEEEEEVRKESAWCEER